ncbi:MAG: DUF1648 domain-containing protein [Candidatus Aminicenantes bacterium]|nr:DUF1648 domain-containing protein [Candidatus Aminicenantes bacterium]
MQKKSLLILFVFNCILVVVSWILALYSYPRLPEQMPFWINFLGQPPMLANKSPVFFVYPIVQTLFVFFFIGIAQILSLREKETGRKKLLKDYVLLSLIFFNLIFIHVLSSLILLAHQIGEGINRTYFFMIFIVILILIPYYRMRAKLLAQEQKNGP